MWSNTDEKESTTKEKWYLKGIQRRSNEGKHNASKGTSSDLPSSAKLLLLVKELVLHVGLVENVAGGGGGSVRRISTGASGGR